jgi:carbonic anhydrase/acetyltransferase-like protein (isoleucine patch superfamily)
MNTLSSSRGRRLLILTVLVLVLGLLAAPIRAADTRGGEQVVIGRDQVISDDLYVAASTVTIDGTVKGDVVAVASQIIVNGTIEGDLLAAGQGVLLNGRIGDDMRVAGQAIVLGPSASVGGDLAVGAMSLENQAGSVVKGDLLVGAYQALLAGEIGKDISGSLDRMELRGSVGGNVDVAVNGDAGASAIQFSPAGQLPIPSVRPNLTLADSAQIGGKLTYTSKAEAALSPSTKVAGGIAYAPTPAAAPAAPSLPGLTYLQRLAGLLLIGVLLLWLIPAWTRRMADTVQKRPLPSLAWGLIALAALVGAVIVILVLTIALAILFGYLTLGGLAALSVGLGLLVNTMLVIGAIAFMSYVAQVLIAYTAGRWLLQKARPAWAERPVVPLVAGLILYVILRAIPGLGMLVGWLVVLLALGALWEWGRTTFRRIRPTPAPLVRLQTAS